MTLRTFSVGILAVFLASVAPAAADPDVLAKQAIDAYRNKDFARSADLFVAAIDAGGEGAELLYNAACASALAGRTDAGFALLVRAVAAGYDDPTQITKDSDLASLHQDTRWGTLVQKLESAARRRKLMWNNPLFATPYREVLPENERIAGVSRLWAEAKFNFVNFELVADLDWDAVYMKYLALARREQTTREYYELLAAMAAQLHDGHTGVWPPKQLWPEVYARPALQTLLVEDRVVIADVYDPALRSDGLDRGLEIVAVDGRPVKEYAETRIKPYESASTPQDLLSRTYESSLLAGSASVPVVLTLRDAAGRTIERRVPRLPMSERKKIVNQPPLEIRMLPGDVAWIVLRTFDDAALATEFESRFHEIADAKALILDVRENGGGNSGNGYRILACLTAKPFQTSRWRTRDYRPTYRAWGRAEATFAEEAGQVQPNGKLSYTGPVVVLTSARTYSAAEDFVVAFDAMKRGTIVGEPTGGSTGQPLLFDLPGGGTGRVCTKRDSYPDGREFVGVGITPQVLVRPLLQDLRAGRDSVLEAALAMLHDKR